MKQPKKWCKISVHFSGRNQHKVKNRFISLISKENALSWSETKRIMKEDNLKYYISLALKSLLCEQKRIVEKDAQKLNDLIDCNEIEDDFLSKFIMKSDDLQNKPLFWDF